MNLVVIKIFNTRIEAEILVSFLKSHNIESTIQADDEGGGSPFPLAPSTTGVKVLIYQKDYPKVMEFLKEIK